MILLLVTCVGCALFERRTKLVDHDNDPSTPPIEVPEPGTSPAEGLIPLVPAPYQGGAGILIGILATMATRRVMKKKAEKKGAVA